MNKYPQYGYTIILWSAKSNNLPFSHGIVFLSIIRMHLSIFLNEKRQVTKYIAIDFIDYFKTRGSKSPHSLNKVTTSYVDICPPIISVEKKERLRTRAGLEFHFFHLYYRTWEKNEVIL